ncbi:S1C family serine protease [Spirillospora sp. CA-255316]
MTEESREPVRRSSEDDDLAPGRGHGRQDAAGAGGTAGGQEAVDGPQQAGGLDDLPVDDPPPPGAGSEAGPEAGPGLNLGKDREPEDDPPGQGGPGVADQLVAGFAPPDSYTRDTDIPGPPPATAFDQPLPAGSAGPGAPGGPSGPGAPAGPGGPGGLGGPGAPGAPGGPGAGEPVAHEMVPDGVVPDGPVPDGPVPPAPGGPEQGRPRPGFVPHGYEQDPRMAAAHQQPGDPRGGGQGTPYGWPPQQSHQPPPLAGRPPGGPPPGAPMGPPPGGPRPMGVPGGPPGMPPGSPNWAPVPSLPSASRGAPGLGVLAVIALVVALVAGGLGAGIGVMAAGGGDAPGSVSLGGDDSAGQAGNRPPDSVAGVARRVLPSVVMIRVSAGGEGGTGGTGFIVNGGYIITNNHVVAQGGDIQVVFNDKKTLPATVKGRDPRSDIAVLKPEGQHSLPPLTPGNSDQLAVGDPVIAIGSPLGLQGSVTTGIVSSLNRAVPTGGEGGGETTFLNAIQTDAAINPGNSGGPLVDARGRVIGINTAIVSLGGGGGLPGQGGQAGNIGLGFAIPINQGKRVAESIINNGSVKTAMMGVVPDPRYQQGGARIIDQATNGQEPVTKNGPADKAGLQPGDVITKVDGRPIEDATDLIALIRSKAPGDRLKVTYQRGGRETTVDVTLAAG